MSRRPTKLFRAILLAVLIIPARSNAEPDPGRTGESRGKGTLSAERARLRKATARLRDRTRVLTKQAQDGANKVKPEIRKAWREQKLAARAAHDRVTRRGLKRRWGETLRLREAQDELRSHARRMARLHRIAALASELGKEQIADRTSQAIAKEQQRHQQRMEQLRVAASQASDNSSVEKPSSAAGAASTPPPTAEGVGGAKAEAEQ